MEVRSFHENVFRFAISLKWYLPRFWVICKNSTNFRKRCKPRQVSTFWVSIFVESCWEMLRPCRVKRPQQPLNKIYAQQMRCARSGLRTVERACQTASTFREQIKCWDVATILNEINMSLLNMSQRLSTLLRGCVKRPQHRLSTNVERRLRQMLTPFAQQPRTQGLSSLFSRS